MGRGTVRPRSPPPSLSTFRVHRPPLAAAWAPTSSPTRVLCVGVRLGRLRLAFVCRTSPSICPPLFTLHSWCVLDSPPSPLYFCSSLTSSRTASTVVRYLPPVARVLSTRVVAFHPPSSVGYFSVFDFLWLAFSFTSVGSPFGFLVGAFVRAALAGFWLLCVTSLRFGVPVACAALRCSFVAGVVCRRALCPSRFVYLERSPVAAPRASTACVPCADSRGSVLVLHPPAPAARTVVWSPAVSTGLAACCVGYACAGRRGAPTAVRPACARRVATGRSPLPSYTPHTSLFYLPYSLLTTAPYSAVALLLPHPHPTTVSPP